ncbi:hypothetical protein CRD60_08200 [Bifidobacterium aemilianum]|uniref:Uncharacterized protein n=1 Tax=Bifidobacterium aemilianum TaxID=2493120 RepID=A0A366K611_9BIFI|nr:hypothetical protein [Bifidobacterium aemilianum]RBP97175.1 hypothetical protein CRD60_08200 [Bifidobacterium aemilianum]
MIKGHGKNDRLDRAMTLVRLLLAIAEDSGRDLVLVRGWQIEEYRRSLNLGSPLKLPSFDVSEEGMEAGGRYADRVALGLHEVSTPRKQLQGAQS